MDIVKEERPKQGNDARPEHHANQTRRAVIGMDYLGAPIIQSFQERTAKGGRTN